MRIVVLLASLVGQAKGVFRASPVVSLAVSVSAAGFVEGGVLLSSYRAAAKGELLCPPAADVLWGWRRVLEVFIFVFFGLV